MAQQVTVDSPREKLLFSAKVAEQAERYQDMTDHMKKVVEMGKELNEEERNLLSVAYKNVVGSQRSSWRVINSIEHKASMDEDRLQCVCEMRQKIEKELKELCDEMLLLCEKHLIPTASDSEAKVFFMKMKGDYYRYLCEIIKPEERQEIAKKAADVYEEALQICLNDLSPTNPIRLGLALNYSVYHYEIRDDRDAANKLAKSAFDLAISKMDSMSDDVNKDSTLILQLLRDNLTLWSADSSQDQNLNDDE